MKITKLIAENAPVTTITLYGVFLVLSITLSAAMVRDIERDSIFLHIARTYADTLNVLQDHYSEAIVSRTTGVGVRLAAENDETAETIPFPVTFINHFGKRMNDRVPGLRVSTYSHFPFPGNKGRRLDQFEMHALSFLEQNPEGEYFIFDRTEMVPRLRFARAVIMKEQCADCHNQYDLGRHDKWSAGNFRGVREVSIPLIGETFDQRIYAVILMMAFLIIGAGVLLAWPAYNKLRERLKEQTFLAETLRHAARHDALTGLPNRAALLEHVEYMIALSGREGRRFAVIFLDLNGFKPINDNLGHDVGDMALKAVASVLKKTLRESDFAARFGGDEFTVLIPSIMDICIVCDRIERAISGITLPELQGYRLGASLGVAVYPDDGTSYSHLIAVADGRMYDQKRAKKEGQSLSLCPVCKDGPTCAGEMA